MADKIAPCPLCGAEINPMSFVFKCPACGTVDNDFNIMTNCEYCHFAPHFIQCPKCQDEFGLMLLMGEYRDQNDIVIPPAAKKEYQNEKTFNFRKLDVKVSNSIDKSIFNKFGKEILSSIADTDFTYPFDISFGMIHTAHISDDGKRWLHVWLYADESGKSPEEKPFGQITLVCPGSTEREKTDDMKGKCVVRDVFWPPA